MPWVSLQQSSDERPRIHQHTALYCRQWLQVVLRLDRDCSAIVASSCFFYPLSW